MAHTNIPDSIERIADAWSAHNKSVAIIKQESISFCTLFFNDTLSKEEAKRIMQGVPPQ
ncbi:MULTISPECIES: hypothetical protein [unclassified Sulfurospirillum]|uniref:hypothetical protein n=1 Tax=unclassified Sulfurospirillum TaxID=2618290 RepID=UPI000AC9D456|nr:MULTISPECIES: hypothetical protein [unclassified Sulfurospirillum]